MAELSVVAALVVGFVLFVRWIWREGSFPQATTQTARSKHTSRPIQHGRERILFVCTHNSARSQMAEAMLRDMAGDRFDVASAGTSPTSVHPLAESVMADRGLSLRSHHAKPLSEMGTGWDYVITLCDEAFEECPEFPAKTCRLHWSIKDPVSAGTAAEQLEAFRRVRDDLVNRIERWVADRRTRV